MTPAQRRHMQQRKIDLEHGRLGVLGGPGKKVFFEPRAEMSDEEVRSALKRPILPMPGVAPGSELERQVGPAWDIVSRLWPEMASRISLIRHFTDEERAKYPNASAAIHTSTGNLVMPQTHVLDPAVLWHELVHIEQRERGVLNKAPMQRPEGWLTEHGRMMESEAHQRGNMQSEELIQRAMKIEAEEAAKPVITAAATEQAPMTDVLADVPAEAREASQPPSTVAAEPPEIANLIGQGIHQTAAPTGIPLEQGEPSSAAADLADPLKEPAEAGTPKVAAKKKREPSQPNWSRFLSGLGSNIGFFGRAMGSQRMAGLGDTLSKAGRIGRFISHGTHGPEREGSGIESVIGGEDAEPLANAVADMAGGSGPSVESAAAAGSQAQANRTATDLESLLKELIDVIKKNTEEMQKQQRGGVGGTHMPEGGSFGGMSGESLGGIGEALGLSPGELQLIVTMFRSGMMAA